MSGILTEAEVAFLQKIEQDKIKHREASMRYRASNKDKIASYNKIYNDGKKTKLNEIKSKLPEILPTPINIQEIVAISSKIDRRTRRGKKATKATAEIVPNYIKRKEPLEYSSIEDYMKKADMIQRIFVNKSLSQELKAELRKLFNDNQSINEPFILNEMAYVNDDIEPTIHKLRAHYKNDNTFRGHLNVLTVITSHLKTLNKSVYQTLTKLHIYINKQIQEKRKYNKITDKEKIIDLDKTTILSNIKKLKSINDVLIYALYTLQPPRRLEYRLTRITTETDKTKLEGNDNYLIVSTTPKKFIFNNYKTSKTYKQQEINVEDDVLNSIINKYIYSNELKYNDYLLSLNRNKEEIISQPNFSSKVSNVFKAIYGISISIRFLRMSWSSNFMEKNPSVKEVEDMAYKLAHSEQEFRLYDKKKNR